MLSTFGAESQAVVVTPEVVAAPLAPGVVERQAVAVRRVEVPPRLGLHVQPAAVARLPGRHRLVAVAGPVQASRGDRGGRRGDRRRPRRLGGRSTALGGRDGVAGGVAVVLPLEVVGVALAAAVDERATLRDHRVPVVAQVVAETRPRVLRQATQVCGRWKNEKLSILL